MRNIQGLSRKGLSRKGVSPQAFSLKALSLKTLSALFVVGSRIDHPFRQRQCDAVFIATQHAAFPACYTFPLPSGEREPSTEGARREGGNRPRKSASSDPPHPPRLRSFGATAGDLSPLGRGENKNSFSRRFHAPSPRLQGEGWGEGALPLGCWLTFLVKLPCQQQVARIERQRNPGLTVRLASTFLILRRPRVSAGLEGCS